MQRSYWFIALGIVWTIIFSGISFYWTMGSLIGVRSLGGSIYEMSLNPSFVMIVWLTSFIKLHGLILLLMLLFQWNKPIITRMLYCVTKIIGSLLFLYGLLNFITISLSEFNVLEFDLDSYATFLRTFLDGWRGILLFSVKKEYDLVTTTRGTISLIRRLK